MHFFFSLFPFPWFLDMFVVRLGISAALTHFLYHSSSLARSLLITNDPFPTLTRISCRFFVVRRILLLPFSFSNPLFNHVPYHLHTILYQTRYDVYTKPRTFFFFFSGGIFVPYYDTTLLDIHILYKYSTVNDEKTERKAIYMYAFCIKIRVILQVITDFVIKFDPAD